MERVELQQDIRSAMTVTYGLLRHEHVLHREWVAQALKDLETELARIEAKLGGPRAAEIFPMRLDRRIEEARRSADDADTVMSGQIDALLLSVRQIERRLTLLGGLPAAGSRRSTPALRPPRAAVLRRRAGAIGGMALSGVLVALAWRAMRR